MLKVTALLIAAGMLALLTGCASDDSPTGSGGTAARTIKADPSFAADIQEIFDRRGCTGSSCHGAALSAGLDLRSGSAYANLVNVNSSETGTPRVAPGDAQNSYLVIKIEGRQTSGAQMPLVGPPLDSIDIQNIRNWIDQGAADN